MAPLVGVKLGLESLLVTDIEMILLTHVYYSISTHYYTVQTIQGIAMYIVQCTFKLIKEHYSYKEMQSYYINIKI